MIYYYLLMIYYYLLMIYYYLLVIYYYLFIVECKFDWVVLIDVQCKSYRFLIMQLQTI